MDNAIGKFFNGIIWLAILGSIFGWGDDVIEFVKAVKDEPEQVTQEVVQPPPEPDRKPLSIDEHKEIIEQTEDKSKIALLGDVSQGLKRADNVPDSAPANQRYIPDPGVYEIMYLNNIPDTNFRLVEMRILREDGSKKWADRHWDVEPGDWGFRIDMGGWKDGTYTYQLYVNDAFIREKHFSIDNGIVSQREAITVGPE